MPSRALSRRDPPNGKKGFSTPAGFTVIEMMMVLAVIAVIISLALPSYRALIEKRQVTSGAEQLSAFLSSAQLESVKRNREVGIRCVEDSGGCETFQVVGVGEVPLVLRTLQFATLKADVDAVVFGVPDANQVVFDPVRGMLVQRDIVERPIEIQLSSRENLYALNVQVSPTGWVLMCSDKERAERCVPGFPSCSAEPDFKCN